MMLGFIPITFRFRGKTNRLLTIYDCFLEAPPQGLHPYEIARSTGINMAEVTRRLDTTPELFIKVPGRDGLTRYRLTSAMSTKTEEAVEAYVQSAARREAMLLFAVGAMLVCVLLIVVILIGPAI